MNGSRLVTFTLLALVVSSETQAQQPLPQPTPSPTTPAIALPAPTTTQAVTAKTAAAATTPAAPGTQTPLPKDPEKFDTSLPVEITSDSLEVLQHENRAIFKGNVVAVQGEVRLKSDVMIVHYKNKGATPDAASAPVPAATLTPPPAPISADGKAGSKDASKNAPGDMGAITLIEVEGNVFMATPEESAKGDKGDYDVPTRMLHLTGSNVVLTRDKNIMRGTALEYNMETGRSILTNGEQPVAGSPNAGPNGGRVHSVFVPNQTPQTAKPPKPATGATPAAPATAPAPAAPAQPPAAASVPNH